MRLLTLVQDHLSNTYSSYSMTGTVTTCPSIAMLRTQSRVLWTLWSWSWFNNIIQTLISQEQIQSCANESVGSLVQNVSTLAYKWACLRSGSGPRFTQSNVVGGIYICAFASHWKQTQTHLTIASSEPTKPQKVSNIFTCSSVIETCGFITKTIHVP